MPANPLFRWFPIAGFALCLCLLCAPPPAHSHEPPNTPANPRNNSPIGIDDNDKPITAQALYNDGCWYVKHGRNLNYAIRRLRKAVALSPRNADYHLALGCALAERVTSLSLAEDGRSFLNLDQHYYKEMLDKWEKAQSNSEDPLYKTDAPKPPVVRAWDDQALYEMSKAEAQKVAQSLATEAFAETNQALTLANSPRAKGEVYYTRGWLRTLLHLCRTVGQLDLTLDSPTLPKTVFAEVGARITDAVPDPATIHDFENAREIAPKNVEYWRSLGDAHIGVGVVPEKLADEDRAKGIAAYKKALGLKKTVDVWERLLDIDENQFKHLPRNVPPPPAAPPTKYPIVKPIDPTIPPIDSALAASLVTDMRQAAEKVVQLDGVNAASHYRQAYAVFLENALPSNGADAARIADEITASVESGNAAAYYDPQPYTPHVPLLLQAAFVRIGESGSWYADRNGKKADTHKNVSKAIHSAIDWSKKQHDNAQALQRCQDMLKMSFLVCDKPTGNPSLDFFGWVSSIQSRFDITSGYAIMTETATTMGDRHLLDSLQDASDDASTQIDSLSNAEYFAYHSEYYNQ